MNPPAGHLVAWQRMVRAQVDSIIARNNEGKKTQGTTIFQALLDSDLPPEEKSADRLQDEGQTIVGAGSETTAKSLAVITFYLVDDKKKLARLREELKTVMPSPTSPVTLTTLEQLPYLVRHFYLPPVVGWASKIKKKIKKKTDIHLQTAVINEGIRLMFGVTTRLPRVSPNEPLKYKDWVIPPGVRQVLLLL
jgi:cytochrome P450